MNLKFDFQEYKKNKNGFGNASLFGAFPSSLNLSFGLLIKKDVDECQAEPDFVKMVIHADEWNTYHGKKLSINMRPVHNTDEGYYQYTCDISFSELLFEFDLSDSGLFYYHYLIENKDRSIRLGGEHPEELEVINGSNIGERQLLLYTPDYTTSKRFEEGVVYHIFVDRFAKSEFFSCPVKSSAYINTDWDNGIPQYGKYPGADVENNEFFGGNLYGIIEKLEYISSLGVSTIYLSPIFEAYSNHKYDTGDYLSVDKMFGGDKALRILCNEAEKYGINVILDGVFNHTGDDSIYFNKHGNYRSTGAYQSKSSLFYEWYNFTDYPDEYECWWGVKTLPRINTANQMYTDFINNLVIPKWMNEGISGWRLDVADELSKSFLYSLRKSIKKCKPDSVIIGEVWEDASNKISYGKRCEYLQGLQLDSVMNYPLREAVIDYVKYGSSQKIRMVTEETYRRYPKETSDNLLNFLGTHDTERIITVLGGASPESKSNDELADLRMNMSEKADARRGVEFAFSIIAGLPGVPCIFYGDEVGLEGYRDPFCRKPFPWNNMDNELLEFYRKIGCIRKEQTIFREGYFKILKCTDKQFIYLRYSDNPEENNILIIANRNGSHRYTLPHNSHILFSDETCRFYNDSVILSSEKTVYALLDGEALPDDIQIDAILT